MSFAIHFLLQNVFFFFSPSSNSNIDGITGFSEEESQSVFCFMNVAIQLAKSSGGSVSISLIKLLSLHGLTYCLQIHYILYC